MWRAESARAGSVCLVLGATAAQACVRTSSGWTSVAEQTVGVADRGVLAAALEALQVAVQEVKRLLETSAKPARCTAVRVLVSDSWLDAVSLPWSTDLLRGDAAQRCARRALELAGCEVNPDDEVRIDDLGFGQPRLVVRYPAYLLEALAALADALVAPLESVLPISMAAMASLQERRAGAFGILEEGAWTLVVAGAAVQAVETGRQAAASAAETLALHWQRSALRSPQLAQMPRLPVLALSRLELAWPEVLEAMAPRDMERHQAGGLSTALQLAVSAVPGQSLDAVRHRPRPGMVGLAAAIAAVLIAALVLLDAAQANRALQLAHAELGTEVPRPAEPRPRHWTRQEQAQVESVNRAVRTLNLPVAPLLAALQPPPDLAVQVLSADAQAPDRTDAATVPMTITAETGQPADMLRYVAYLAGRRPFVDAALLRHELVEQAHGRVYRFTLEASWRP